MTDADILTELYEVIKQNKREEYAAVIEKRAAYPYLYHPGEPDWFSAAWQGYARSGM